MNWSALLIEAVGWVGALLILGGYWLVSTERLRPTDRLFQWLNIIGAAGFIVNGVAHGAWPSATLNVLWLLIGLATLWRLGHAAKQRARAPAEQDR